MTLSKVFLPLLASSAFLGGCVYEEVDTGYREPRRVYHRGYDEPTVVVEKRHRDYYDDRPRGYYREQPVTVYEDRPRVYRDGGPRIYGGGTVVVTPGRHGESYKERQERELREAQRAEEERHDKKDDHKKKKKKDHDDDDH